MGGPEAFMREAIALASRGVERGDGGPFGAVVAQGGRIIGRGWNRVVGASDPTAHAEIIAIRDAARRLGTFRLSGCELFATCEPCPMCLGAAYWARLERIFYAASGSDAAAMGFDDLFIREELGRPAPARRLPARQLLRDEALEVFTEWRRSALRVDY